MQIAAHRALGAAELGGELVEPAALVAVAALVVAGEVREAERQRTQFPAPAERCGASVTEPGAGRGELTPARRRIRGWSKRRLRPVGANAPLRGVGPPLGSAA
jgi:hypothetical protein